ncbi:class III heat-shock ATP-dependent LonA protease [Candidatus Hydrogenisulfobacillus filiaventi]|uniref:Lon protease n=1 Tax=Candidatus Hydrogenisulfobacillus filiaventi TaxID=2707344 RepID=A0A6F8ZJR1_9FIRM|nr:endopeptidase La [Bacillota bacterium]CAB1129693.1 class III heat-shock ATP-dependent LonA protease [Candidatus Hydrogenisulfobacillus filiaventi]
MGTESPQELPLLPLRGVLVFPYMVVPLEVGRAMSLAALEAAMVGSRELIFVSQKDTRLDEPGPDDLYRVGVVGEVKQLLKLSSGASKVVVEGKARARVLDLVTADADPAYLKARVEVVPEAGALSDDVEALMHGVVELFEQYIKNSKRMPEEAAISMNVDDPGRLADTIISYLDVRTAEKQAVLELFDIEERLKKVYDILSHQIELLELERRINVRVRKQMERSQREYYLREQLKAIQKELGEPDEHQNEVEEFQNRLEQLGELPKDVEEKIQREIDRLSKMPAMAAEAVVVRNYLEWLLSLPWTVRTEERLDVREAERILEEDHYGLERVKERILEYLAVRQLSRNMKGPILCLVGPPGVGKTSLARSIARATGRNFVRVSLGGVRDEAEIRGHRRTYVGAMPGRIIQGMRQAGAKNPLFLLDEVDKMAMDFRGDPSAALLEVLDPEQNSHFSDHYIEIPFDLSEVMFITTANVLHTIPRPLLDRMETISIAGYTEEEKLRIAQRYLLPKQLEANGLADRRVTMSASALALIIRNYTREAGVRQLEREIGSVLRKVAREVVSGRKTGPVHLTRAHVLRYLGPARVHHTEAEHEDQVGLATGLAVTEVGGDVMPIEVTTMPGKGQLVLTGQLGDVMQESARAAFSYVRSRAVALGIEPDFYEKRDIHVHVPEGGIPKDGPSAGITMAVAMISALSGVAVRSDVAMTGEVTLRGRVLAVGGIKEKVLAAHRAGIREIILPKANKNDLEELPAHVRRILTFHLVERLDEVLNVALPELGARMQALPPVESHV